MMLSTSKRSVRHGAGSLDDDRGVLFGMCAGPGGS